MSESTEVVKQETKAVAIVPAFDIAGPSKLPNLHTNGVSIPADFVSQYWSPVEGEVKRGFIQTVEIQQFPDMQDATKMVPVKVVKIIAQDESGTQHTIMNASKRLVNVVEQAFQNGQMISGTPVEIAYLGKIKNKTNGFESGRWSIKPIAVTSND